ncbi:lipoprotein [Mizugakiibacter sediminis]|uniref:Lipoprotein n=1 Tax=Mizugakiibacter sediminis TaxID=1475481 RepID=A0A0K8QJN0_9GAMM|nr:hypothetical protein [Mizugakiibacter sediminis]GAP65073.1 lipoprotein [Mizugakiibacter sediminis]
MIRKPAFAPLGALLALALALPGAAHACACGCGVFDVAISSLFPSGAHTTLFAQAGYIDQTRNWSGTASAPAADNDDLHIRSSFYTAGVQTMFDRRWGLTVALPYTQRHLAMRDEDSGELLRIDHGGIGDVRVLVTYTGFSPDLSSGLDFGVKLPTGDWTHAGLERDTQIGTGTTDLLLGGFHRFGFGADARWSGFARADLDLPSGSRRDYRPGAELNGVLGAYPQGWQLAPGVALTPVLEALLSARRHDRGAEADADNTGFTRVLAAAGLDLRVRRMHVYADVEAPLYQNVRGNQLIAPWQLRFTASVDL